MLQLIYMSEATGGPHEVRIICEQASSNNIRNEITGVIFLHNGHYFQALEGSKEHVEDTLLRIIVDPRHKNLHLLSRTRQGARQFGPWAMVECVTEADKKFAAKLVERRLSETSRETAQLFLKNFSRLL